MISSFIKSLVINPFILLETISFIEPLFIVKTGTIKITRVNDEGKEVILALLGPGEIFGELAILDGEARSANALAQENCELVAIQRSEFLNLLRRNFKISFALMGSIFIKVSIKVSDVCVFKCSLSLGFADFRIGKL